MTFFSENHSIIMLEDLTGHENLVQCIDGILELVHLPSGRFALHFCGLS